MRKTKKSIVEKSKLKVEKKKSILSSLTVFSGQLLLVDGGIVLFITCEIIANLYTWPEI